MKKIILVNPDIEQLQDRFGTVTLTKLKAQPPLGLCAVAAPLEAAGHKVSIVDGYAESLPHIELALRIQQQEPDIVGFSVTCLNAAQAEETATLLKSHNNNTVIVFGGPQTTLQSNSALNCPAVDYAVLGEGDLTFPLMVEALEQKIDLSAIAGLIWRDASGTPKLSSPPIPVSDLNILPLPSRHLIDWSIYDLSGDYLMPAKRVFTISSSRGCPYRCTFCSSATYWKSSFRARSPKNVVDEIEVLIHEFGADGLNFREDNFMVNHKRVSSICSEMVRRGLRIPWVCEARVDNINYEILSAMKEAGLTGVWCGVESGSPTILKQIKKGYSVEQVLQAFGWINKLGLKSRAGFMIGFPDETEEDIEKTLKLSIEINPTHAYFQSYVAFPRSELYDYVVQNKLYCGQWRDVYNVKPRNIEKYKYPKFEEKLRRKFDATKILNVNNNELLKTLGTRILIFCTAGYALIDTAISMLTDLKKSMRIDLLCNQQLSIRLSDNPLINQVFCYHTDFLTPDSLPSDLERDIYNAVLVIYNNSNGRGYDNVLAAARQINCEIILAMNYRGVFTRANQSFEKKRLLAPFNESTGPKQACDVELSSFVMGAGLLHLGCGGRLLDGWLNIDLKKIPGVIQMKLPEGLHRFEDASMRLIYASHFLEHLDYPEEALSTLKECHRLLIPDGTIRLVVPGIEKIIRAYCDNDKIFFESQKHFHPSWCTTKLEHLMYALQQDGEHKYGYDFETLKKLLSLAGFRHIIESDYNESLCNDLQIDYRGKDTSLFVEASRIDNTVKTIFPEKVNPKAFIDTSKLHTIGSRILVFCTSSIAIVESALQRIRNENPDCILEALSNQTMAEQIKTYDGICRQHIYRAEYVALSTLSEVWLRSLKEQHYDKIFITFSNGLGQGYENVIEVARQLRTDKLLSYNSIGAVAQIACTQSNSAFSGNFSHDCELNT
jgi:anaerobic magnesium-protoporphyrin IX monomethyl ester cyclase